MMGNRGRGRGMPGRGGPLRGRGGPGDRGMRGGRGMMRGMPITRGNGRVDGADGAPPPQGEAIPIRGGPARGIPTRGTYPPRGMMPPRGRGIINRGMPGGRGFDRGGPRGRGDRGRGGMDGGMMMPRGRGGMDRGGPPRGRGGLDMRGRGGDIAPRGRGGLPQPGGFESRPMFPRGGPPRGRGGYERGRSDGEARGRGEYIPRGRGVSTVPAISGYPQRAQTAPVERQAYRTPVPQSTEYRGYAPPAENLKRPPMGVQQGMALPQKRGRYEEEPAADPYQSSYYRSSQSGYDNYSSSQTSYTNGSSLDYHQHSGGYSAPMASEMAPQETGGYMASQTSSQSYASDPYSYSQGTGRMAPAEQSWGTTSDPYSSSVGYGSATSYTQQSSAYNGRGYNTSAPSYDSHSYGGTYGKQDYGTSAGSYSQSRDYEMDRRY